MGVPKIVSYLLRNIPWINNDVVTVKPNVILFHNASVINVGPSARGTVMNPECDGWTRRTA